MTLEILYEDDDLLVISKPAGLISQQSVDARRPHVLGVTRAMLHQREGSGELAPYVALHHRLDRDTTGVLVLSRSKRANAPLMNAFKRRQVTKHYIALTSPVPKEASWPCVVENHLAPQKNKSKKGPRPQVAVRAGGDYAKTHVELLSDTPQGALLYAKPSTGRRHQVRAHLSTLRAPILGDALYGGLTSVHGEPVQRVMLHALALTMPHPVSKEMLSFCAPIPMDFRELAGRLDLSCDALPSSTRPT